MRRRLPLLVVTACSALAVGCSGGGDKPSTLPSLIPTPVTSASPAPIPPQATPNTSQGLDAFVRFYFQQLNVAFSTSDPSLIRRYSDPSCDTCNNFAQALERSRDTLIQGDSFAITGVAAPPLSPDGTVVTVLGATPARTLVHRDGTLVERLPAGERFNYDVRVVRNPAGWLVRGIRRAVQQ